MIHPRPGVREAIGQGIGRRISMLSFRDKILLITLSVTTVALLFVCLSVATWEYRSYRKSLIDSTRVLLEVAADNASAALAFHDRDAAAELIASLRVETSIEMVSIRDAEGREFARYERTEGVTSDPHCVTEPNEDRIAGGHLLVSRPILLDRERIGTVHAHVSLERVHAALYQYSLFVVGVLLLSLGVAFLMISRTEHLVTRPIRHLVEVARSVAKDQDYSTRARRMSDDELGDLVDSMNHMLSQIEARDLALRAAHDALEDRVEQRTAELLVERDRAREASRAKTEFLANISHELRTPMHAILSFATFGVKMSTAPPETLRDFFIKIQTAGGRLLVLLNDLLDLSKLEAGRMEMEIVSTDLDPVVDCVVDEFRSLVSERGIKIHKVGQFEQKALVDSHRIMQVLRNLIGNAVKFSPPGSEITVQTAVQQGKALIIIEDQGVGVPDDEIELVFDKFVQSRKTKTGAGGTGLGLSICREIVNAHNGRVWARPGRAVGAEFHIELPLDLTVVGGLNRRADGDAPGIVAA